MKYVRIKLIPLHLEEMDKIVKEKGISRDQYISEALDFYSRYQKREKLVNAFAKASQLVRESSMEVNAEFDCLIDEGVV